MAVTASNSVNEALESQDTIRIILKSTSYAERVLANHLIRVRIIFDPIRKWVGLAIVKCPSGNTELGV